MENEGKNGCSGMFFWATRMREKTRKGVLCVGEVMRHWDSAGPCMEWRPIERGGKKILESLEGFLGGTLKGGEGLACGAAVSHRRVKLLGGVMRH